MGLYGPKPIGQVTSFCTENAHFATATAVTTTAAIDTVATVTGGNDRAICYLLLAGRANWSWKLAAMAALGLRAPSRAWPPPMAALDRALHLAA